MLKRPGKGGNSGIFPGSGKDRSGQRRLTGKLLSLGHAEVLGPVPKHLKRAAPLSSQTLSPETSVPLSQLLLSEEAVIWACLPGICFGKEEPGGACEVTVSFGGSFAGGRTGPRIPHPPAMPRAGGTWEHRAPHLRCHEANVWLGEAVASWCESLHKSEPLDGHRVGIFPPQFGCVGRGKELAAALPFLLWTRGGKPPAFSCLPSPGTSPEALDGFLGGGLGTNSN